MGAFYGRKILGGEINQKTGEAWRLQDVPLFWKSKTEQWLKDAERG